MKARILALGTAIGVAIGKVPPWAIYLVAFAVRVALIVVTKSYVALEHAEPAVTAFSVLDNGTYANPYCADSGPTAHVSPVYVWMLVGIFAAFGRGVEALLAQELLATACACCVYMLLPYLSETLGLGRVPGVVAGLLGALIPFNFWAETKGTFEQPVIAALLIFVLVLLGRAVQLEKLTLRTLLPSLFFAGLLCLAAPTMIAPSAVAILLLSLRLPDRAAAFRMISLHGLAIASFLLPWGYRNHQELGKWIFTRSNFGLELLLSNNDRATADYNTNLETSILRDMHPMRSPECRNVVLMGEAAYHDQAMKKALAWIQSHPQRFLTLTAQRAFLVWVPIMARPAQTLMGLLLVLAGIAGYWQLRRTKPQQVLLVALIALAYQAPYMLVHTTARYSYPIQFLFWLGAGIAAVNAAGWVQRRFLLAQSA